MALAVTLILTAYLLLLLWAFIGLRRAFGEEMESVIEPMKLSVIIPFRNEVDSMESLLKGLSQQDYPVSHREFIFVDDHSTDGSAAVLAASTLPGLSILSLPADKEGKKRALTLGAQAATGEVLVFTDADCLHHKGWLSAVNGAFMKKGTTMAIGMVRMLPYGLQSLEFSSLTAITAAGAALGNPLMCNGANLACQRSAFLEVGGYEGNFQVPSGDDEFLMRKVKSRFPGTIRLMTGSASVVTTGIQPDLKSFIGQRIRWAGKWKFNTDPATRFIALLVFMVQLATVAAVMELFVGAPLLSCILLSLKVTSEAIILVIISRRLDLPFRFHLFLLTAILYPAYVMAAGGLSLFAGYRWKGRASR